LTAALTAADRGLIEPILIGPENKLRSIAEEAGLDLSAVRTIATPHSHASAARAVELVRAAEADAMMKGSLHTDELMGAIVARDTGLRTARRISHVFVMLVPGYDRPLLVTDAAINIEPCLEEKVDIVQNAIDLSHALGIPCPRVALLSAVETVTSKLRSTIDAAALCKMADRGQITGGLLDGPLAFDNAVSLEAARTKGIVSEVAGRADILVTPDLESGNILAKQLEYFAHAVAGGIVLGARVPVILSSRADSLESRVLSCGVAVLLRQHQASAGPAVAQ
jgi:phosphotransacetylase